ncbi:MAG: DUF2157 domain-containing protein [Planctomycetes bacterium]|nr:DUF2157 domain-containing protein [Planctomycetota bacterium]
MEKRPLTQSMRQWLLDQLDHWRRAGLVNEDQANAIVELYETPTQSSERHQSIAIYILIGIAAMFVALGAFLCITFNWQYLPKPIQLFVLLTAVAGSHGLGFYLRYGLKAKIFSEFAFFFGCLLYGGAIALIANIFDMHENIASGFWWWALGVFLLALFLDTVLLHLLTVTLLAIWVGIEMMSWRHHELDFFELPRLCYTLPIFAGIGLLWSYQKRSPTTVGLYVPLVAWWLVLLPLAWRIDDNLAYFIGSVGALLLIVAEVHPEGSRFAIPYRLYGAILCMGILCVLSFHGFHRGFWRIHMMGPFLIQTIAITLLSVGVFTAAFLVHSQRGEAYLRPMYSFAIRQWLPLSMALLMLVLALYYAALHGMEGPRDTMAVLLPTALANIGMLVLAFWLMMFGLREDRGFPAAGGVVFFLLWSVLRYAEYFGAHGQVLGAACMFFACGAAIFGFAMFWHFRKKQRRRSEYEQEQ